MKFDTLAVHAGAGTDAQTGAVVPPLHLSTTFEHAPDGAALHGFTYQRGDNPTQQRLETALALLDGGEKALFCASGMAAGTALLQTLTPGSHVLLQDDLYHGFRTLARDYFPHWSLAASSVDMTDPDAVAAAMKPATRLVWAESPSNPLLKVVDIEALAELAHARGAELVIDSTFATPVLQQPLALGADIVLHSATKYMGGHSDVVGGALVFAQDDERAAACRLVASTIGLNASPFAAWLVLRGLRSLPVRVERHCANARAVAGFLADHPRVEAVHYPGLATHAQHALAARQMRDFGGMLSFRVAGDRADTLAVAGRLRLFVNATSLGGCESLVEHRASSEGAHAVSPQNLLRLSVGLEHPDDLIADLAQALAD
ncbi:MAG TPA: aminotransferase class I/II-fold pyridoxal phosphate-dependent enzyme [Rhodanobacteraceae bacterium]|nr:aminotransferase class I/II-fold pyridoxal phosphate-dependent enzyme [Rhodanobacteraceae bacterium]